jgi:N-acetylglucosaminyldiphosphoundecaprenol N-acetyl-beta-D-mannosaminyltransferase
LRRHNILGVGIHNCGEDEAINEIERFLTEQPPSLHQVCTVNPEFVMEARRNPAFCRVVNNAALATPDGIGIILAGRLLRRPFKGRATGVALVERIARLSNERGLSIFMLGAGEGVAKQAADALKRRHSGMQIAGTYAGSPDEENFQEIKTRLDAARPDILLVAYGAPKQDLWIESHRDQLPGSIKVAMGVGGVFDYLSGEVPLAPPLLRRFGLEWLYRLVKQPWRWRRILRVLAFALLVIKTAFLPPKRQPTIRNS